MTITVHQDGQNEWHFYRKSYRKARWRKVGQRMVDAMLRDRYHGLVIVI